VGSIYGVAVALICGDAFGNLGYHLSSPSTLWLATSAAVLLFLFRRANVGLVVALLALAGSATLAVGEIMTRQVGPRSIQRFADGSELSVEGILWREPERSYGRLRLLVRVRTAKQDGGDWQPCEGMLRATLLEQGSYRIGDRLRMKGRLRFPRNYGDPGEFDYEAYMARAGIVATMLIREPGQITVLSHQAWFPWSVIERARAHIARFIDATLSYPEREEARALTIGDRGGLGTQLRDDFALTGMAHLLIISGLHMGFVAAVAFMFARLVLSAARRLLIFGWANKIAALISAFAVVAYALVAGHHVSTIRAVIMVATYAVAMVLDRSSNPLAALATAAAAIILALPGSTADIGFQLSFATVGAIVLGMRRYSAWWLSLCERRLLHLRPAWPLYRAAGWLGGYLALSCYATAGVLALTAYHFNQFSLIGPLANAVVVPIMGLAGTIGTLCAVALSVLLPRAASVLLYASSTFLAAGAYLARFFAAWPLAWVRCFTPTFIEVAIFYGLILLWLTRPLAKHGSVDHSAVGYGSRAESEAASNKIGPASWRRPALIILLVALVADGSWWGYQRFFNPTLRITFLAVGQGDATVIQFPGSRVMVIDGGGGLSPAFDPGERLVARFLWSQKVMHVDYLTLSHPDFDHYGGLTFLARNFGPREFWAPNFSSPDPHYATLLAALALGGVRLHLLNSSTTLEAIGGVELRCVNPPALGAGTHNNGSAVLMFSRGANRVLFTGDIEAKAEQALIATYGGELRAALIKVPHHGSKSSSTAAFVNVVHPAVAVISLGHLNRFHFPSPLVVERYIAAGARVLRTDEDGAITVELGPDTMRVRTSRRPRVGEFAPKSALSSPEKG
jgi:competence protein ComEC